MAMITSWFDCDLQKAVQVQTLNGNVFSLDNNGSRIAVRIFDGGAKTTVSGSVTANCILPDGSTVNVNGTLTTVNSQSVAYIDVPQSCLLIPGWLKITIKLTDSSVITTLAAIITNVYRTKTDNVITPSQQIISDWNAEISTAIGNQNAAIAAQDTKIESLKSAISNTAIDVLRYGTPTLPISNGGVQATKVDDSTIHAEGTISSSAFFTYYANVNALPQWLEKGKTYTLVISGATSGNTDGVYFEVLGFSNGSTQVSFTGYKYLNGKYNFKIPDDFVGGVYIRVGWLGANSGHVVNETITYHIYSQTDEDILQTDQSVHFYHGNTTDFVSCDDVPTGVILFVSSSGGVKEISDFPFNSAGTLVCMGSPDWPIQYAFSWNTSVVKVKSRNRGLNSTWNNWADTSTDISLCMKYVPSYSYESCDDIANQSILFIGSSGGVLSIPDAPFIGFLQTIYVTSSIIFQIMYPWQPTNHIKYRIKNFDGWTSWLEIGSGSITNVTQNITRDTYNNTINITTSPTITTDSNGWLQPVDTNTADETGKTDMSGAILSMLNDTGYCHLAPGIYYVSGNIDMPANSMIEGCGKQTIIRLLQSVNSGYIARMHTRSTIKNVCFSGGYSAGDISDGNIGGRKGIIYIGNRDGHDTGVTPSTCTLCQIEGCWFENLDSGFYGYNAGGGLQEGVEVSNCYFTRCKAGINIDYWTEYSKFVNCVTFQCYYGCINNGGNNVFMNCTFHGVIGFLIDNSAGDKANSAHGSVIGCTFNHIDNMNNPSQLGKGIGIKVLNTTAGFIFANCQLWYGRIHIENSSGIQISGCEFGGIGDSQYPVLELSGSTPVFIDNCLFQSLPSNSISCPVKFSNCWTYAGVAVT